MKEPRKRRGKTAGKKPARTQKETKRQQDLRAELLDLIAVLGLDKPKPKPIKVKPGALIPLELTKRERDLILDDICSGGLPSAELPALKTAENPVLSLKLEDWDEFMGWVAASSNHCRSRKREREFDALCDRIDNLLETHKETGD
jgi:hypothetical protein